MHVVLIGAELEENLALRYLASALETRRHTFELAAFDRASDEKAVIDAVLRARPPGRRDVDDVPVSGARVRRARASSA